MPVQDQKTPTPFKFVRWQLLVIFVVAVLLTTFFALRPTSALTNNGSITAFGSPLTEPFDSLSATANSPWADNVTIPGWYASRTTYNVGNGSSNAGALYSFGTGTSTDRALGSIGSGSTGTIYYGVKLTNNTGGTITSVNISYVGEQWRNGGATAPALSVAQTVDFQYQVANAGTITGINTPTTGWVNHDPLDFTSPTFGTSAAANLDGNLAANRVAKASTITVTINNGQEIWLRWMDIDHSGNDHGLAIDDFSITANGSGSTNPTGTGAATPNSVAPGDTTLLTVAVTPGTSPISSGLAVSSDLTSIGGSNNQQFYDDGSHGDAVAGDKTFSFSATVANGTPGGAKNLTANVSDGQGRSSVTPTFTLTVVTPTPPTGVGAANPASVQAGDTTLLTVAVTPGANPTSTGITVTGDLSSIGGSATQQFFDNGTNGDATANNNTFSFNATVALATALGSKSLPITITDGQGRTGSATIALSVQAAPTPAGAVVLSQVYGGGGNSGAFYRYDFIEIFNRSSNAVDLTGWSVQYASAGGGATAVWNRRTPLSGTINPGQYILIREASGNNTGAADLPTPDIIGSIAMGGTDGKVALVRNNVDLPNGCPLGNPNLIDFVGYGAADCYEGFSAAPVLTNTTAALRSRNGCKDTDYNGANFTSAAPSPRNSTSPFNFCPPGDESPEVFNTTPASGGVNAEFSSDITISFDEPVGVTGNWFQISCTKSGLHTATVTGGPSVFTLNPDTDFVGSEQCTVTVYANQVNDLDTNDPPDNMSADYTWSFGTVIIRDPAEHMVMGNPSGAVTDVNTPLNYLMMKPQYALSYNNDKGTSNWTSWHLDNTWLGGTDRLNDFRSDDTLPPSFKHVSNGYNFATYQFDRGHMTPSADRTSSEPDNSATFLMTNMIPQASGNNQGPWNNLEGYIRTQLSGSANEIYIVSGGTGVGGNSLSGHWDSIIDTNGNTVTVPKWTWKVVMVLPNADGDDVARVDTSTRTFAVIMPNDDNIRPDDWKKYLATVDQVEALSGYNFFSNVPENIQNVIEARLDEVNDTTPVANGQSVSTAEDTQKAITLTASDFNVNNVLTYIVVTPPAHGSLNGTGSNLSYMPDQDYFGPDSFTFKVNDGAKDSNVATVNINVTSVNDAPTAVNDSKETAEDTPLTFAATDVLSNDAAGPANESTQTLTVMSVTSTPDTHGSVSLSAGQVTYNPAANYNGPASFDYQVCDNGTPAQCSVATVNVNVTSVNDAPDAVNDSATVAEDSGANAINVLANDTFVPDAGETLTISATTDGAHGTVAITGGGTGLTYTPNGDYNGTDSFTYTISDGNGGNDTATVSITVTAVNDAPVAKAGQDQTATCTGSVALDGTGSSDVDDASNTLSYVWREGSTVIATGATPTVALSVGVHTITLTVTDPHTASSQDTVIVTVIDDSLPVITLTGQAIVLSSANHQYETINLAQLVASASDACDSTVDLSDVIISQVTSDEAENGNGDGNTNNDIVIAADCKSVQLRAERAGVSNGRVYTITFQVSDTAGNTTTATAKVTVPKSGTAIVDDGPQYTVNGNCH